MRQVEHQHRRNHLPEAVAGVGEGVGGVVAVRAAILFIRRAQIPLDDDVGVQVKAAVHIQDLVRQQPQGGVGGEAGFPVDALRQAGVIVRPDVVADEIGVVVHELHDFPQPRRVLFRNTVVSGTGAVCVVHLYVHGEQVPHHIRIVAHGGEHHGFQPRQHPPVACDNDMQGLRTRHFRHFPSSP